eukprot:14453833-Alexandrium_andersonii.AAC.1
MGRGRRTRRALGEGHREPRGPSPRSSSSSPSPRARACPSSDVRIATDPSLPAVRRAGKSPRNFKREKRVKVVDRKDER